MLPPFAECLQIETYTTWIMIQWPFYLTPEWPAYVAVNILFIFKERGNEGSEKGYFQWFARAMHWIKFLKIHIHSQVPSFLPLHFLLRPETHKQPETYFESQCFVFPKSLSFHKGWCCGSQWKRITEVWRVVWVVGGGGFRGKWWVPFDSLVGRSLVCKLLISDSPRSTKIGKG